MSRLGSVCLLNNDFDSTLKYYHHAVSLYESSQPRDSNALASCLTGISNAYRGRRAPIKALDYAQRAWTFYESSKSANDKDVANSLHLLADIHHELGDNGQALKLGTRALVLMERIGPSNTLQSAELLKTLGLIQMKLGDFTDSQHHFERAVQIYTDNFPSEEFKTSRNRSISSICT